MKSKEAKKHMSYFKKSDIQYLTIIQGSSYFVGSLQFRCNLLKKYYAE